MMRSMYSAISGMKGNQTKLDVIGNNIANVNTTGFKASRARFAETLSQNMQDATAASVRTGGVNGMQIGLGTQVAAIDKVMTIGNLQSTNNSLDVAIDGKGYLMVSTTGASYSDNGIIVDNGGSHGISNSNVGMLYTRDGALYTDNEGNLLVGSGYRVLGYSLTNDINTQEPTEERPGSVTAGGFNFAFGAGTQLNGYNIVLGNITKGTATNCEIDTVNKKIIINADFSEESNLTRDALQKNLEEKLTQKGISQTITVGGKLQSITDTTSDKITGGQDATSPSPITFAGMNFTFPKSSSLNGYQFRIGNVAQDDPSIEISAPTEEPKYITINGNFVDEDNLITKERLQAEIDRHAELQGVKVTSVSTSPLSALVTTTGEGTDAVIPGVSDADLGGLFKLSIKTDDSKGTDLLNNAQISLTNAQLSNNEKVKVNYTAASGSTAAKISIQVDFNAYPAGTSYEDVRADVERELNKKLEDKSVPIKFELTTESGLTGNIDTYQTYLDQSKFVQIGNTGKKGESIPSTKLGYNSSLSIDFPSYDELFNKIKTDDPRLNNTEVDTKVKAIIHELQNLTIKVVNVQESQDASTTVSSHLSGNTIELSGNFSQNGRVTPGDLQAALNKAVNEKLNANPATAGITFNDTLGVKVGGESKVYTSLSSVEKITGGTDLTAPTGNYSVLNMNFTLGAGSDLNDYSIKIGNASSGTALSVDIDKNNHAIIINGDFTSSRAVNQNDLQNAIDKALEDKGINQRITVDTSRMNPIEGNLLTSQEITGGTPRQSLDANGNVNFVNAAGDYHAYDNNLKTLKLPTSIMKNGEEQKVTGFQIDGNGVLLVTLADKSVAAVGQLALADFANEEGLTSLGGNMFQESQNSGAAVVMSGKGGSGDDNSGGFGSLTSNHLEMSNVDLSEQFTEMITATRAFQASSKMISTGDEVLQDIINLKR